MSKSKLIVGVDPGVTGAIVMTDGEKVVHKMRLPITDKNFMDAKKMQHLDVYKRFFEESDTVVLEELKSIYGIRASSNWTLAKSLGGLYHWCDLNFKNVILVTPKQWQQAIMDPLDYVWKVKGRKKKNDTKMTARNAVKRIFPTSDLRDLVEKPKAKVPDHNYVDAALLSYYGKITINDI